MTLFYQCSKCGAMLETSNADPLHAEIERLRAALQAIVNYEGESFDFPSNDGCMIVDIARKALEQ